MAIICSPSRPPLLFGPHIFLTFICRLSIRVTENVLQKRLGVFNVKVDLSWGTKKHDCDTVLWATNMTLGITVESKSNSLPGGCGLYHKNMLSGWQWLIWVETIWERKPKTSPRLWLPCLKQKKQRSVFWIMESTGTNVILLKLKLKGTRRYRMKQCSLNRKSISETQPQSPCW